MSVCMCMSIMTPELIQFAIQKYMAVNLERLYFFISEKFPLFEIQVFFPDSSDFTDPTLDTMSLGRALYVNIYSADVD